ncbi:MAG: hypothetical protein A2504_02800 [Bdellovibrionales bacterium RIFOXYD12_FULL_39_22]|nr:MAG: hypothetical protein A2385_05515 [Bdellovibrionales bacterium RIFOXYB1_FULL_39_21]OFZ42214.1 MAG: hypothetical protein A2485_15545 [Bdellovibrionales bacterium RIFOXYC12_FULL_39_17]OFZ46694.1 MAG: hypothetical protein A2404_04125 [Bdellovibrionales bacterium RIFOXYC1_FULL_39_130]OFZ74227.1 MAG: hypothetical protein A2451_02155 [Bdellovibrionales bacterium RIFOXYC2_FULL_39_8]OFZ76029.1 MAG: hypothetical protein A2560_03025 [Bdellovibrionales bacterium RIFOXYD1_FULL_39_84]OFZ93013.1 MAG:
MKKKNLLAFMVLLLLNVSCSSSQLQQRDVAATNAASDSEQTPQQKWDSYLENKHRQHLE